MDKKRKNKSKSCEKCLCFSLALPLDFRGEKEHFEDKPTLRTRSN